MSDMFDSAARKLPVQPKEGQTLRSTDLPFSFSSENKVNGDSSVWCGLEVANFGKFLIPDNWAFSNENHVY